MFISLAHSHELVENANTDGMNTEQAHEFLKGLSFKKWMQAINFFVKNNPNALLGYFNHRAYMVSFCAVEQYMDYLNNTPHTPEQRQKAIEALGQLRYNPAFASLCVNLFSI